MRHRLNSAFGRRATVNNKRRLRIKKAAVHPVAPEKLLRNAIVVFFRAYNKRLIEETLRIAHHYLKAHRSDAAGSVAFSSIRGQIVQAGKNALQKVKSIFVNVAKAISTSVQSQLKKLLDLNDDYAPNFTSAEDSMTARLFDGMEDLIENDAPDRAEDILEEWDDLDPDTSPRAEKQSALEEMLNAGLDGITGTALALSAVVFGKAFGDMVRTGQKAAGVEKAEWVTQHDDKVRPAHRSLDGVIFGWDDPPLTADLSSNEEDCFPGDDFNCRCLAAPVTTDSDEDTDLDDPSDDATDGGFSPAETDLTDG